MVATTDRYATEVGVEVLRSGGNAVDAAVAVALALAVVNPEAGNLGGGGFAVVRAADGSLHALDFRSTAPAAATRDTYAREASGNAGGSGRGGPGGPGDADGDDRALLGHLAVAVPGSVRGLHELHLRLGRRPWRELVQPAVELARGFEVRERLTRSFPPHIVAGLARFAGSAEIFLPGGEPPRPGETFRQPDLARTLAALRDGGADAFYAGETARLVAAEMERGGGIVTARDFSAYRAVWREPLRFRYRGRTVVSMPPSSSGGVALAETAHILAPFDLGALPWHGAGHVHLLAEAWKRAFADRNRYLADPAFVEAPLETLLDPAYGRWRADGIRPDAATPSERVAPGVEAYGGGGDHTTHLSVVDGKGGAVALTTTLNTWYGSKVVAGGTGVLLNNEMDDLSTRPGMPNHFGLVQGEANAVAPGKRPLSAMTPTLVLDAGGDLRLVLGNAGGATIITTVFQILSSFVDHGMPLDAAVRAPRVHHQHLPDRIQVEPGGLDASVVDALRGMGHSVEERDEMSGDAHVVAVGRDGTLEGVSDPRRGGVALGL